MNTPTFTRNPAKASPFSREKAKAPKTAAFVVEMEPSLWADGRKSKPTAAVNVGLRLLAEETFTRARAVSIKHAWANHARAEDEDLRVECYNARLMGELMAEAACMPNDHTQKFFEHADIKIFLDLTPEGIRYLWDHYEAFAVSTSPTAPEATDEELLELGDSLLAGDLFEGLDLEQSKHVRRLLKAALKAAKR
jgi:hypothetical protein